jgi:hypothetical protein
LNEISIDARYNRGMRFLKLRIAWSVFWGLACVLLIVLWVRSYSWVESIQMRPTKMRMLVIASMPGFLQIDFHEGPLMSFGTTHQSYSEWRQFAFGFRQPHELRSQLLMVRMQHDPHEDWISIPYWFAVLLTSAVAGASWIRWTKRFSLRTLLIATTLVAVVLGLIAWSMR